MTRPSEVHYRNASDRAKLGAALGGAAPAEQRYGDAVSRLIDLVKERGALAESARTPLEKVEHLEAAKCALAELAACRVPGSRFRIEGLAGASETLDRLELTYRAFGFYRMAGRG